MSNLNKGYTYNTIKCFAPAKNEHQTDFTEIEVPIAKSKQYLQDEVLRSFEDCQGNYYELRLTDNGSLVALLVKD